MNKKVVFGIAWLFCFLGGVYAWKVQRTGRSVATVSEAGGYLSSQSDESAIVYVADAPVSNADVDFEYQLHTRDIADTDQLTYIPALDGKLEAQLLPLRQRLASGIIERKALFKFIERDRAFDLDNPKRYEICMQAWQDALRANADLEANRQNAERLKVRICELDIVQQYLNERVYAKIQINESDVATYYKNNADVFKQKDRVVVRHILLGNEDDAKRVRHKLTPANFAVVAKEQSLAPESAEGGILGPYARGEYPSVFDVAFAMRTGEISGVLKSNYGFHILMVTKKLPKTTLSLAEAHSRIQKKLRTEKQEEEYQKWVELALNSVQIQTPKPLW